MSAFWPSKALADVCEIKPPKGEAKRKLKEAEPVSFVPMEDLGTDQKYLEPKAERKLGDVTGSYTYFADGDVLLAKITPCFENGKLGIAQGLTNGIGFGSSEYIVFRPTVELNKEYLYYFLLQDSFRAAGIKTMSGAVGHKRVSKEFIERCKISLPPIAEQQRIVAILDEAFVGLATAIANAMKNLENARELFDSYLNSIFSLKGAGWVRRQIGDVAATQYGLSGTLNTDRKGYKIFRMGEVQDGSLVDTGRMKHIDIGASDFKSYRLHRGDVLFNRTNSSDLVGKSGLFDLEGDYCFASYLVRVNFNPAKMESRFAVYLMNAGNFLEKIRAKAARSVNQANINATILRSETIDFPEDVEVQRKLADKFYELSRESKRLEAFYADRILSLAKLKQSILQKAFFGELAVAPRVAKTDIADTRTANFTANVLALAYERHRLAGRERTFGHKKAQKLLHLVEAAANVDLGRDPIKDAAGPNDFGHMLRATAWAEQQQIFRVKKSDNRYVFERLPNYKRGLEEAKRETQQYSKEIDQITGFLLPMNSDEAEVVATVYAAWNNLIIKSKPVDDEAIVREAREDWHLDKMNIPRHRFFDAIELLKKKELVPKGRAKLVREKYLI